MILYETADYEVVEHKPGLFAVFSACHLAGVFRSLERAKEHADYYQAEADRAPRKAGGAGA